MQEVEAQSGPNSNKVKNKLWNEDIHVYGEDDLSR